jgi:hypothetical protein
LKNWDRHLTTCSFAGESAGKFGASPIFQQPAKAAEKWRLAFDRVSARRFVESIHGDLDRSQPTVRADPGLLIEWIPLEITPARHRSPSTMGSSRRT